jgi:hypothetical protein
LFTFFVAHVFRQHLADGMWNLLIEKLRSSRRGRCNITLVKLLEKRSNQTKARGFGILRVHEDSFTVAAHRGISVLAIDLARQPEGCVRDAAAHGTDHVQLDGGRKEGSANLPRWRN